MSLFSIVQILTLLSENLNVYDAILAFAFEWVVAAVIYVVLVYQLTKRRVELLEQKQSIGQMAIYAVTISMFAGIIVGVFNHISIGVIGYEVYIARYCEMLDMLTASIAEQPGQSQEIVRLKEQITTLEPASMFEDIVAQANTYMVYGVMVGLISAIVLKRKLKRQKEE